MSALLSAPWIADLVQTYGLWAVFAVVMLESTGLPLPGETVLVSAAIYAGATHQLGIIAVIATATLAAIVGDNCGYAVGRHFGLPLVQRHGRRVGLSAARLQLGQYLFQRHGGKIVLFGRFVAFLRCFAAVLAGVNQMRWSHFLAMNALGALCWAGLFGGAAYLLGSRIERIAGPLGLGLLAATVVAVVAGGVYCRRHERELLHWADLAFGKHQHKP